MTIVHSADILKLDHRIGNQNSYSVSILDSLVFHQRTLPDEDLQTCSAEGVSGNPEITANLQQVAEVEIKILNQEHEFICSK